MPTNTQGRYQVRNLSPSWTRYLRAHEKSQFTIRNYQRTLRLLSDWLDEHDASGDVEDITADHIQDFIDDVRDRTSTNNALFHYRNVAAFYAWIVAEKVITRHDNPMPDVIRPKETPVPRTPLDQGEVASLLKACSGTSFEDRRDTAILRVLLDTGVRLSGLLGTKYQPGVSDLDNKGLNDVFLDHNPPLLRVRLKGGRVHLVDLSPKTSLALDRYLRVRAGSRYSGSSYLWLGRAGTLGVTGVSSMIKRRAAKAGLVGRVHPHRFRRTMATWGLDSGQSKDTVKRRGGWQSDAMVDLYVSDTQERRAWTESQRLKVADQV